MAGFRNNTQDNGLGAIKLPTDVLGQLEKGIEKQLSRSTGIKVAYFATIGNPITSQIFVPDTNNSRVFIGGVGDEPSDFGTMARGTLSKAQLILGMPIVVQKNASGSYSFIAIDAEAAAEFLAGDEDAIDQSPITQSQLDFGTLQPFSALVAVVKGAIYGDSAVTDLETADFSASPLDTTSNPIDIPTTANRAIGVLVQLDPATSTLSYKQSSQFNAAISLSQAYVDGLLPTRDAGKFRKGYLRLVNGITEFDYASVWTCPEWFPDTVLTTSAPVVDNALVRYDGTTGRLIQEGLITEGDTGILENVNGIQFDITPSHVHSEGLIWWNDSDKTINVDGNVSGNTLQVGQEMYVRATNKSGADMFNGDVAYVDGAQGQRPTISPADASSVATSDSTIGVLTHDIANNATGFVTSFGFVRDIDTSAWSDGAILYLSTTAGALTDTPPTTPDQIIRVAIVTHSHATTGSIFVNVQFMGPDLLPNNLDAWGNAPDSTLLFAGQYNDGTLWHVTGDEIRSPILYTPTGSTGFGLSAFDMILFDSATDMAVTASGTPAARFHLIANALQVSGGTGHTLKLPAGVTFNGTDNTCTFNSTSDFLEAWAISSTRYFCTANTVGVTFSST